jgi:transcriptional regulator with XRE-family HTH domain
MNRYEQRKQKRLRNPEIAEGYRQMAAEIQLLKAIEKIRVAQHISKESLANQMGKKRETVSRLLNDDESNPTLETLMELLSAMGITADITLRPSQEGEEPIKVTVEEPVPN